MNFKGKVALVSGATSGIGRSIAETLSMHGITVIGTSTSKLGAKNISIYLGSHGKGMELDVTNQYSIDFFLKEIFLEFGCIDILINNAGIVRDNILVNMQENEWQKVIDTNLTSIYRMSKAVIRPMIKQRYGRIINIGSVVGLIGNIGQTNYAATKAGLIGFSKSLAREVATRGITVNIVSPGFIDTGMTAILTEKHRLQILSKIPVNKFGTVEDISNVVVFLASDEAGYITGENINVSGGMCML
ncbi:3-oxoacyl-[acyl-carrier-protein] reductase [Blochmannia endosymbiont of Camponotus (Colobopsis) obliquus]|uniref:3-oxoacyl-[acyl-carrier-protein] reductase n=1 Tax=Blochmannia endosymbiont of Camponotus (Colobopsis) obliquus TaxID=1505597 RepID=UPI00061A53DD|nr:3-oxoacyl-[acyl-carrier-protein] reductase [Blochmannia endosymbiont of Camponotus (Colobopsis) obliquus]AKC60563.1 3-oxoacyl-[acyl-carrier-protein] reductase [Blochmannia endosymbiont of Camponotus (Colobopsis) obliquus]